MNLTSLSRPADGADAARCGGGSSQGIASSADNTDDWLLRCPSELARDHHLDSSRHREESSFSWILDNSGCPPLIFLARQHAPRDDYAALAQVRAS